jgi:hypothetical protein
MVIHPNHPGLKAKVMRLDIPCTEYRIADENANADPVVRYIEPWTGDPFVIRFQLPSREYAEYDIEAKLEIDGKVVRSGVYAKAPQRHRLGYCEYETTLDRENGVDVRRTFHFSELFIGNQDSALVVKA